MERRVLELMADGYLNEEILALTGYKPISVRLTRARIYTKLRLAGWIREGGYPHIAVIRLLWELRGYGPRRYPEEVERATQAASQVAA